MYGEKSGILVLCRPQVSEMSELSLIMSRMLHLIEGLLDVVNAVL